MRKIASDRGSVTVFLLLILLPVVIVTGTFVDLTRYNTAKQLVSGAGELTLDSVLANYNSLLQQRYGLFAISPTEDYQLTAGKYFNLNLGQANGHSQTLFGEQDFQLLQLTTDRTRISSLANANLANPDVLNRQIIDYTKYRFPLELAVEFLESLNLLKSFSGEAELYQESIALSEKMASLSLDYQSLYQLMVFNDDFNAAQLDGLIEFSNSMLSEVTSLFMDIYYLRENLQKLDDSSDQGPDLELGYQLRMEELISAIRTRSQQIISQRDADLSYYRKHLKNIAGIKELGDSITVGMFEIHSLIDRLTAKVDSMEQNTIDNPSLEKIKKQLAQSQELLTDFNTAELVNYVEPNRITLQQYISSTEQIAYTVYLVGKDNSGQRHWGEIISYNLEHLNRLKAGPFYNLERRPPVPVTEEMALKNSLSSVENSFKRYIQANDDGVLSSYHRLAEIYGPRNKKAGQNILSKAVDLFEKAISSTEPPELTGASEIPQAIASEFGSKGRQTVLDQQANDSISYSKNIFNHLKRGFDNLAVDLRDRILVQQYLTTMFTCAATAEDAQAASGYSFSPQSNYLYGSELEYCLSGSNKARHNLVSSKALLFSLRYALNFRYALGNQHLMRLVESLALAGSSLLPLTGPVLELSILAAIVAVESYLDLQDLLHGKKVVLFKTDQSWRLSVQAIKQYFDGNTEELNGEEQAENSEFKMSYQDYLGLLLLTLDRNVLLNRVCNLIELNMSFLLLAPKQPSDLSGLAFRTVQAQTAVKLEAEVLVDFIFFPLLWAVTEMNPAGQKAMKIYYNNYRGY